MKDQSRKLLEELSHELQMAGELDPETRKLLQRIHEEIETGPAERAIERAKEIETRFAARHPVAERIARVLIDSLGKMGI